MLDRNWIPFLSWHNLAELLAIEDDVLVQKRVAFLRELPIVAWFRLPGEQSGVGAITDIAAAEAMACCEGLENPGEVAGRASKLLLRFGTGVEAIGEEDWVWHVVHRELVRRSERARAITAIAPFRYLDEGMTLGQLLKGKLATANEVSSRFAAIGAGLAKEVATKGDRRIKDPVGMTADFLQEAVEIAGRPSSVRELVISTYIAQGLEPHELLDEVTIRQLSELATFRAKLRVVAPKTGRSFEELRALVRMERCPHWIIEQDIRAHAPDLPERKGSDLADGYLATLAAYVDHLFVDKRTAETFRRLPRTCQTLSIVNRVSKAGTFERILDDLER
jgi:hypothetical protein